MRIVWTLLVTAMSILMLMPFAQAEAPAAAPSDAGAAAPGAPVTPGPATDADPCADAYSGTGAKKARAPFGSIRSGQADPCEKVRDVSLGALGDQTLSFPHADLTFGWMPYIIQTFALMIGAVSVVVFSYAGVNIFIHGDNPEEVARSTKMLIYGAIGIAIAALSYSIVANILGLFAR